MGDGPRRVEHDSLTINSACVATNAFDKMVRIVERRICSS